MKRRQTKFEKSEEAREYAEKTADINDQVVQMRQRLRDLEAQKKVLRGERAGSNATVNSKPTRRRKVVDNSDSSGPGSVVNGAKGKKRVEVEVDADFGRGASQNQLRVLCTN